MAGWLGREGGWRDLGGQEAHELIGGGYQMRWGGGLSSYQLTAAVIPP